MACNFAPHGSGTFDIVESQISNFTAKGDQAFSAAISAIQDISSTFGTKVGDIPDGGGIDDFTKITDFPTFTVPTEPEDPDIRFNPPGSLVDPPAFDGVDFDGLSRIIPPVLTAEVPVLEMPTRPSPTMPTKPPDPAPLMVPVYPTAPTLTDPTLPTLQPITFPTLDVPDLSAIQAEIARLRNELPVAPTIPGNIEFLGTLASLYNGMKTEIADHLPNLVVRLGELLSGHSTGITDEVAALLRNRAFAAEDQQAFQAEAEARSDWLARGFTLPGGSLESRIQQIRQQARDKKAALNRDLWIEESKQEIENLRVAIQQGVVYEGQWKDSLIKLYGICGQLAEKSADVQLKLLDAAVELYKAKAQVWQVQFSVIKDEIQIELAKVEIYKAELDGQKLVGELNQQMVAVYKAQLDALNTKVSVYKAQIDAANSLLQAELGKLEYAAKRVQIYTAEISAYETEWKAYGEAIRGELGKTELYKSLVQGFSAQVEAYARNIDAEKTKSSLQIEALGMSLKAWGAMSEKFKAELQAESVRVESLAKVYESAIRAYGVKGQLEEARVGSEFKKLDYDLTVDKFIADVTIKNADLAQTKLLELAKMSLNALDSVARTGAQLSGSAMSAMNVGASLSSSLGYSYGNSCSETYSYGE